MQTVAPVVFAGARYVDSLFQSFPGRVGCIQCEPVLQRRYHEHSIGCQMSFQNSAHNVWFTLCGWGAILFIETRPQPLCSLIVFLPPSADGKYVMAWRRSNLKEGNGKESAKMQYASEWERERERRERERRERGECAYAQRDSHKVFIRWYQMSLSKLFSVIIA